MSAAFEQAILNKQAKIGVIGLGYVGLPLIHAFVKSGFTTIGFDVDQRKVDALLAGKSYIKHLDSKLIQEWQAKKQQRGQLTPTAPAQALPVDPKPETR